ncbi:MAG: hypothetical protein ACO1RX_00590 [Candidatus Sericytochromatia bacterium]
MLRDVLYQVDWHEAHLQQAEALQALERALAQHPESPELWARRAEVWKNLGQSTAALADLRQAQRHSAALPLLERARLHSRLLLLCWSLGPMAEITQELARFAQAFGDLSPPPALRDPRPERPLRVGWLSPDFRVCSAALVLEQVLMHIPHTGFEHVAYSLWDAPGDFGQQRFQQLLPRWRSLSGLSAEAAAAQMAADGLDILVDLAGHTSLSGLAIVALQPAPLCFSGLTFNGPLGLPQVIRFSDAVCSPQPVSLPGQPGPEQLAYLPSWIVWPEPDAPKLPTRQLPPVAQNLGCAHHPGRLSPATLRVWMELLKRLPDSQLVLKHRLYRNGLCRQYFRQFAAAHGVNATRLHFAGDSDYPDYLASYHSIDLVLDPFPYHGGLVSCEALWMGCPLVTLSEDTRGGASLLQQVGGEWGIASSPEAYLNQALEIAHSRPLRQQAARDFRARLQTSPICDGRGWAEAIAAHFRDQWRQRCTISHHV